MKNKNKGFTIVELVIVIAVIGILAAVLLPTFKNIIEKANTANDMQIVVNLNKALEIEKASQPGCDYQTPYDAFAVAKSYGYTVEKIVAKSNLNIAYDQMNKRFVLLDETTNTIVFPVSETEPEESFVEEEDRVNYFTVKTNVSNVYDGVIGTDENGDPIYSQYSVYAGYNFNATTVVLRGIGFDAGVSTSVNKIQYTNSNGTKDIVIRTNSYNTDLTVNAPYDTVRHYGKFGYNNIVACAQDTFIEYGDGAVVEVTTGHIYINSTSNVKHIHFTQSNNVFDNIVVTIADEAKLPSISRDSVTIAAEGTLVCTLETVAEKKTEYIWLTSNGVYDEVKVSLENDNTQLESIENGTDNSKEVAEQICNTYKTDGNGATVVDDNNKPVILDGGKDVKDVVSDVRSTISADDWDGTIDTSWYDAWKKSNNDEFVITTAEQLAGVAQLVNEGTESFKGKTIKLGIDLNLNPNDQDIEWLGIGRDNSSYSEGNPFRGTFDGQGHTILNVFQHCYVDYCYDKSYGLFGGINNATIKNFTISANMHGEYNYIYYGHGMGAVCGVAWGDCTFEDITVKNSLINGYILSGAGICGGVTHGHTVFRNIDIKDTVLLTTWYNACDTQMGGVVGAIDIGTDDTTKVSFENITIACQMYPILDSAGAYQWFQYRAAGMLVGGFCQSKYGLDDNTYSISEEDAAKHLTCTNVKVYYDSWADQTYCEFHELGHPSYADEGDWKTAYIYPDDETVYERNIGGNNYSVKVGDLTTHVHYEDEMHNVTRSYFQLIGGRNVYSGSTCITAFAGVEIYRYGNLFVEE